MEMLASCLRPQAICHGVEANTKRAPAPKVAVDAVFARRLLAILKMCAALDFCTRKWCGGLWRGSAMFLRCRNHHGSQMPLKSSTETIQCPPCPLRSCIPGPLSAEAGLVYGQGLLLVLRTLLTDYVSRLEGQAGRWIIQQDFAVLSKVLAMFVAVSGSRLWRLG